MTEEIREKIRLEDGRKAEKITKTVYDDANDTEVIETWVEPKVKLHLAHRQIVRRRPCVYERETEVIDEKSGEVINREVEDLGQPELQVREQIVSAASLPEEPDSGHVTREELREDISNAVVTMAKALGRGEEEEEESFSVQSIVEERMEENKSVSMLSLALLGVLSAEVAGLAWMLFVM